jgi:hypothetical protein
MQRGMPASGDGYMLTPHCETKVPASYGGPYGEEAGPRQKPDYKAFSVKYLTCW